MDNPNILVIGGSQAEGVCEMGWPGNSYDSVGIKLTTRKTNYYHVCIDYHNLTTVPNREAIGYLRKINRAMVVGGELNLFVPSLEWAAEQIVYEENPSPITLIHLFGNHQGPGQYRKSGYTLRGLRRDLSIAGFAVRYAQHGFYTMTVKGKNGEPVELEAGQHIIIANKREEDENAFLKEIAE